ncbi:transposase, partial [Mycobacterium tuberculosis H2300]
QTTNTPALTT